MTASEKVKADEKPRSLSELAFANWSKIPPDTNIQLKLHKGDVEALFVSIRRLQDSHVALVSSVVHLSNNQLEQANVEKDRSISLMVQSMDALTDFMDAAFAAAEPVK